MGRPEEIELVMRQFGYVEVNESVTLRRRTQLACVWLRTADGLSCVWQFRTGL